jgi:hypothetical protein
VRESRELVDSLWSREGRASSISENKRTPSVKIATSWSSLMRAARLTGTEARFLVRLSKAKRMMRVCATSEWTWVTIAGISFAAEMYGPKYCATVAVVLRRPNMDVVIVKGSIIHQLDSKGGESRKKCGLKSTGTIITATLFSGIYTLKASA